MNIWVISSIIAGLLILSGIVAVNIVTADQEYSGQSSCSTYNGNSDLCSTNSCTAQNNCGRSTCEATRGGSCGCNG